MVGGLGSGRAALADKGHLQASLLIWKVRARDSGCQDRIGRGDRATQKGWKDRSSHLVTESQREGEDKPSLQSPAQWSWAHTQEEHWKGKRSGGA